MGALTRLMPKSKNGKWNQTTIRVQTTISEGASAHGTEAGKKVRRDLQPGLYLKAARRKARQVLLPLPAGPREGNLGEGRLGVGRLHSPGCSAAPGRESPVLPARRGASWTMAQRDFRRGLGEVRRMAVREQEAPQGRPLQVREAPPRQVRGHAACGHLLVRSGAHEIGTVRWRACARHGETLPRDRSAGL